MDRGACSKGDNTIVSIFFDTYETMMLRCVMILELESLRLSCMPIGLWRWVRFTGYAIESDMFIWGRRRHEMDGFVVCYLRVLAWDLEGIDLSPLSVVRGY